MKILEMIFLILAIVLPLLLVIFMLKNIKKVKKHKKFRTRLIILIFLSLFLNLFVYGGLKTLDKKDEIESNNETEIKESNGYSESSEEKESTQESNNDGNSSNTTIKNKTSKGYTIEVIDGVTYINGMLIVNKTYPLPSDFVPKNTHKEATSSTTICQECIDEEAYQAFQKMKNDAASLGLTIWIQSGYRSYSYQSGLYNGYVNRSGKEAADTYSARPGNSEHQSGLAFDLNSITDAFANTEEGKWVNDNCYKYGFIIRYPKDKDDETGYKYESWHLRYVGTDLAAKLYNAGDWITLESYLGITSKYAE